MRDGRKVFVRSLINAVKDFYSGKDSIVLRGMVVGALEAGVGACVIVVLYLYWKKADVCARRKTPRINHI